MKKTRVKLDSDLDFQEFQGKEKQNDCPIKF